MVLTQKETSLLQDLKTQEQLCVDKYEKYSASACDEELKNLFSHIGKNEQRHLEIVSELLSGEMPNMSGGSGSMAGNANPGSAGITLGREPSHSKKGDTSSFEHDKYLCDDALSTEKYVSSSYDTSIFEFVSPQVRDILNHNQKEEQEHGEQIFNYMQAHGMYKVK